jgi:predicted NUDIX family NTP pyrophosphohydrolase
MSGPVRSAGLLPYRRKPELQVLIAHPGGPWFEKRDNGAWSLVKGIVNEGEDDAAAAIREFEEETGWKVEPHGWIPLGETVLKSRKTVVAWAVEADFDLDTFEPGTFMLYGREYPEIDEVRWMTPEEARVKLNPAQTVFIDRLIEHLQLNEAEEVHDDRHATDRDRVETEADP